MLEMVSLGLYASCQTNMLFIALQSIADETEEAVS
jgi:hypothetical protein